MAKRGNDQPEQRLDEKEWQAFLAQEQVETQVETSVMGDLLLGVPSKKGPRLKKLSEQDQTALDPALVDSTSSAAPTAGSPTAGDASNGRRDAPCLSARAA